MSRPKRLLPIGILLILVFGVSFFVFYKRAKTKSLPVSLFKAANVINQRLPKTNLVSASGQQLADDQLRHGKVILAFMMPDCPACDQENEFLKTVVNTRADVRFLYVIPFGNRNAGLKSGSSKYPIEPAYDNGSNVAKTFEMNSVPIKLFLEDGIIKRTWVDATVTPAQQAEFRNWLGAL